MSTIPNPGHFFDPAAPATRDDVQSGMNLSFGGGSRIFLNRRLFVSPEFRVGLVPMGRATVGIGYVVRKGSGTRIAQERLQVPPTRGSKPRSPLLEIAPAVGYAFGSGAEDPAPSLAAVTLGATFWFERRFGIAVTAVRGVGKDLYDRPLVSPSEPIGAIYSREYLGKEALRYYRTTLRYRRSLNNRNELNVGVGLALGGSFRQIVWMRTPTGLVDVSTETGFGAFSGELLFGRRIAKHLALKTGAAIDFNLETNVLLPV